MANVAKLLSMSWIAVQKLESGISLLINGKIQNRNHPLSGKKGSEKHDTLYDLLRRPLIPVFWVGLCVPWQRSWLSHVAAAAQPTRLNSQSLVPLCTHCFWTWEQTKRKGCPGSTNKKEMKQRQKPWYLAGTNLQTPIFSWFPRLELEEEVTICQETLQISPCKWQAWTNWEAAWGSSGTFLTFSMAAFKAIQIRNWLWLWLCFWGTTEKFKTNTNKRRDVRSALTISANCRSDALQWQVHATNWEGSSLGHLRPSGWVRPALTSRRPFKFAEIGLWENSNVNAINVLLVTFISCW